MRVLLGAAMALSIAAPAAAAKDPVFVEAAAVKDKPAVAIDPAKAYVLLRSDAAIPLHLMKEPTPADQAVYDKMRADALAKSRAKYAKQRARYDAAKQRAAALPKGDPGAELPPEPIAPTEANFEFTPFYLMTGVSIGPMNRFAKQDGGGSVYLQEVTPGSYRVYGPLLVVPNGAAAGTCFCMGSVRFDAKAGEIVDLGLVVTKADAGEGDKLIPLGFRLAPATDATPVDPRLKALTVRPAVYRPAGKLPNYFGVAIDRMPEIPGVMRYERDRIVDLTAAAGAAQGM